MQARPTRSDSLRVKRLLNIPRTAGRVVFSIKFILLAVLIIPVFTSSNEYFPVILINKEVSIYALILFWEIVMSDSRVSLTSNGNSNGDISVSVSVSSFQIPFSPSQTAPELTDLTLTGTARDACAAMALPPPSLSVSSSTLAPSTSTTPASATVPTPAPAGKPAQSPSDDDEEDEEKNNKHRVVEISPCSRYHKRRERVGAGGKLLFTADGDIGNGWRH